MGVPLDCETWSRERDDLGPMGLDYVHLYECTYNQNVLFFALMIAWVLLLMNLLSSTASNYFSPNLGSICEKLKVPYNIAGVTFLALGNAAPDFFALVASFTGDVNILVGVGSLLGGGVFVCTVVVGTIAILCPCKVSRKVFLRDVGFHLLSTMCISIAMWVENLNLIMGFFFVFTYFVYATIVIASSRYDDDTIVRSDEIDGIGSISMTVMESSGTGNTIQTAFWHRHDADSSTKLPTPKSKTSPVKEGPSSNSKFGYSFVTLSEEDESSGSFGIPSGLSQDKNKADSDHTINLSGIYAPPFEMIIDDQYVPDPHPSPMTNAFLGPSVQIQRSSYNSTVPSYELDEGLASLSSDLTQGLLSSSEESGDGVWRGSPIHSLRPIRQAAPKSQVDQSPSAFLSNTNPSPSQSPRTTPITHISTTCHSPLQASSQDPHSPPPTFHSPFYPLPQESPLPSDHHFNEDDSTFPSYAQFIHHTDIYTRYWQQWLEARRHEAVTQHCHVLCRLPGDWATFSVPWKILVLLELPVNILRDLTIPSLELTTWSKPVAIMYPITIPIFLSYVFGLFRTNDNFTDDQWAFIHCCGVQRIALLLLCVCIGAVPSFSIFLFARSSRPPSNRVLMITTIFIAFCMCIVWIYVLAGELIECLSSIGDILQLPPAFLGLTVLAWGNSVGDFFTNTAVARNGYGEMAIAGCYGGPVFNLLVGLGLSLIYGACSTYPHTFQFKLDASSVVSVIYLYLALFTTIGLVASNRYEFTQSTGILLVSLYGAYTVTQTFLLYTELE